MDYPKNGYIGRSELSLNFNRRLRVEMVAVIWMLGAVVVAVAASARGRNAVAWLFIALLLSPLIGLLLVLVMPNVRHEKMMAALARNAAPRAIDFEPDGIYADVPYKVRRDGSIQALVNGGLLQFRSVEAMARVLGDNGGTGEIAKRQLFAGYARPPQRDSAGVRPLAIRMLGAISILLMLGTAALVARNYGLLGKEAFSGDPTAEMVGQSADDARIVNDAASVNAEWERTFDRNGRFPTGQTRNSHYEQYGNVLRIDSNSASYNDARALADKFAPRQVKIDQLEKKTRPK